MGFGVSAVTAGPEDFTNLPGFTNFTGFAGFAGLGRFAFLENFMGLSGEVCSTASEATTTELLQLGRSGSWREGSAGKSRPVEAAVSSWESAGPMAATDKAAVKTAAPPHLTNILLPRRGDFSFKLYISTLQKRFKAGYFAVLLSTHFCLVV
ncbi:MAG TPA: hypothetical protein ENI99_12215 [Sedimenticola sp.]|nr:hypothetical protein [Sedimenticola sp.]